VEGLKRAMSAADSLTLKEFFGILHVIQHSYKPVQADGDLARDVETSALLSHGCTRLALSVPLVAGIAMAGVFAVSVRAAAVGCLVLAALGIVEKAVLAYYLGWLSFYRRQAERFDSALVAIALALAIAATAAPALQDAHALAALAVFALLVRALRILVLFRAFRRILLTISSIASYLAMALSLVALVLFLFSVIGTRLFGDLVPRFLARWDQGCAIVCPSPSSAPIPLTSCVPILLSTPHNRSDSTYMSLTATAARLLPSPSPSPSPSTSDAFSLSFTLSSPSNLTLSSGDLFLLTGCSASAALQCPNGPSSTNNAPPYPSSIPLDSFSLSLSSISSSSTPSSPPFVWAVGGDVVSPLHPSSGSPLHPPSTPPSSRSSVCGARVAVEAPGFLTDAGSMRSLGDASLALFQMLVSSNWHEIIYTNLFAGADPAATLAFFLAFYTVSVAVTFNLVIAIFIDAFETAHEQVYDKDHAMRFLIDRHVPIRAKAARVSGPRDLVYKIKGHDNPTLLAALLEDGERDRIVSAALARASDAVRQNAHSRTE
jgi:Ion transport protein